MKTIYWAGDSTVAYNSIETYPQTGIGQGMSLYVDPSVLIRNYAMNGRSTKSFIDEGRLARIDEEISSGDYLFIQFGHNDEKDQDPTRYTDPFGTYSENLRTYIEVARTHGAQPILITPLERRRFNEATGHIEATHGDYPAAMKEVGRSENVPVIDLNTLSREYIDTLGDEASKELFLWYSAGKYPACPDGKTDNTHLIYHGAVIFAGLIAQELKILCPELFKETK